MPFGAGDMIDHCKKETIHSEDVAASYFNEFVKFGMFFIEKDKLFLTDDNLYFVRRA